MADDQRLMELEREVAEMRDALTQLSSSRWSGDPALRGIPARLYQFENGELPPPSVEWAYRIAVEQGDGSMTPDVAYICLRAGDQSWEWAEAATGTP